MGSMLRYCTLKLRAYARRSASSSSQEGSSSVIKDLVERSLAGGAVDRAVHVGDLVHGQAGVQGVGDLHHRMLAHAVDQKVRAGVEKDGSA